MDKCSMKTGFFFLRDCDFPAHEQCRICGQYFCNKHLRIQPGTNAPVCLDCLGKEMQQNKKQNRYDDDYYDVTWCYGYRHNYYRTTHYSPWYMGHADNPGQVLDDQDVRSFDSSPDDDNDAGDDFDAEASTFDS